MNDFNKEIHPTLKQSLRRDELLGRINQLVVFLPLDEREVSYHNIASRLNLLYHIRKIGNVLDRELKIWRARSYEKHKIILSWSTEGNFSPQNCDSQVNLSFLLVIKNLSRAYDVHYGVRSVVNEVRRVAVQQLAESQIRGDLKPGWVFDIF